MIQIVVPIRPKSLTDGKLLLEAAHAAAPDFIEIWCDLLKENEATALIEESDLPIIANLKDQTEQGEFSGTEVARRERLVKLSACKNIAYIDLPWHLIDEQILSEIKSPIIASYHNFLNTPAADDLIKMVNKLPLAKIDLIKIATMVNLESQTVDLNSLAEVANYKPISEKLVLLGMGEAGIETRLKADKWGSKLTFAALDRKNTTAPGQVTVEELRAYWSLRVLKK